MKGTCMLAYVFSLGSLIKDLLPGGAQVPGEHRHRLPQAGQASRLLQLAQGRVVEAAQLSLVCQLGPPATGRHEVHRCRLHLGPAKLRL